MQPLGGTGLTIDSLDADALGKTLIILLCESQPSSTLDIYSDERRKVFKHFVDPQTAQNKLRVHSHDQKGDHER